MKRKVGALEKLESDHAALRFKLKRDPQSYRDDFEQQYQQYRTLLDLFLADPSTSDNGLVALKDLIEFVSHTSDLYPDVASEFPRDLELLLTHHEVLEYDLRDKIVGAYCLLKRKEVIDSVKLLNTLFPLLVATNSKSLRQLLYTKIISDLRSSNAKTVNHKLNKSMQTALYKYAVSSQCLAFPINRPKSLRIRHLLAEGSLGREDHQRAVETTDMDGCARRRGHATCSTERQRKDHLGRPQVLPRW